MPNDPERVIFGTNNNDYNDKQKKYFRNIIINNFKNTEILILNNNVFQAEKPLGEIFLLNNLRSGRREDFREAGTRAAGEWDGHQAASGELLLGLPQDVQAPYLRGVQRISASLYVAKVELEKPGWVALSEEYASGWKAYLVPVSDPKPLLVSYYEKYPWWRSAWWWLVPDAASTLDRWELSNHVRINGFMQAWQLQNSGSYWLIIEYRPQRTYEAGWLVTIGGVGSMFLFGLIWSARELLHLLRKTVVV